MKTFYLYIVLLLSLGCKAQEFDLRSMKRFDEKVFKDWEVDTQYVQMYDWDRFLKKGDERVRIIKTDSFIQVEVSNIANPYKKKYKYDIRTKRLILGIWKNWSKTGKLIKEVDYDEPYKLSVKDIITLVNQKFNIDLLDMNLLLNVDRYNRSVPIYNIISITKPNTRGQEIRYINISADNGEILFDKMLSSEKDFNDIYRLEDKEK